MRRAVLAAVLAVGLSLLAVPALAAGVTTSLSPTSAGPGDVLTVTGTGFIGAGDVVLQCDPMIGNASATVVVDSDTQVHFTVPVIANGCAGRVVTVELWASDYSWSATGLSFTSTQVLHAVTSASFGWGDTSLPGSWLGGSQLTPIVTLAGTGFTGAGNVMLSGTTSGCAGTMVTLGVISDTQAQFVVPQSFPQECWGEVISVEMAAGDFSWFTSSSGVTFAYPTTGDVSPYYVPPSGSPSPSPAPSEAPSPSPSCPPTICPSSPPVYIPPPPADPLSFSVSSALQGALLQGLATTIGLGVVAIVLLSNVLRLVHMFRR